MHLVDSKYEPKYDESGSFCYCIITFDSSYLFLVFTTKVK